MSSKKCYSMDVRARQEKDTGMFHACVSVANPVDGDDTVDIKDLLCTRAELDQLLYTAANNPMRAELDVLRTREVWNYVVDAYKATVVYGPYGATGDPRATVLAALSADGVDWAKVQSFAEIREVLAIFAMVKEYDGRISRSNREWLATSRTATATDWYMEWGIKMRRLDDIHTTHIDNLISTMRGWRPSQDAKQ